MSISTFQEKFLKGGCGAAILIFAGVGLMISMASQCNRAQQLTSVDASGKEKKVFATVGHVDLPVDDLEKNIDQQLSQANPEILNMLPPEYRLQPVFSAVYQAVNQAEMYEIALKKGFRDDDTSVKKAFHLSSEQDFRKFATDSLRDAGQLKPNSTDKDLDTLIVNQTKTQSAPNGKTLAELYKDQVTEFEKAMKDKDKLMAIKLRAGQSYLLDQLKVGINPTDDDLKRDFEKKTLKEIIFKVDSKTKAEDAKAKADKAYQDLKSGKSFEDVMDAVSEDTPAPGHTKKSENTIDVDQATMSMSPDLKIVDKMQEGTYSEPEKTSFGYVIFKFVGKKMDIPKDFDKNKDQIKQQYISKQVEKKFKDEKDAIEKDIKPTFQIKTYEAAYLMAKATQSPGPDQVKLFQQAYDIAKGVSTQDYKADVAASIAAIAIQKIYDDPSTDKTKVKADRIAALKNYLTFYDNWAYRKDVIEDYKEQKQGDKAFAEVVTAMDKNLKFDAAGQSAFSDISATFNELKAANIGITPEMEKQFNAKQDQWKKDKAEADKQAAELKKQQDEAAKKAAEDAKKNKASAPPGASGGTSGGGLIPPSSAPKK